MSLRVLVPSFMISELKRAFEIGFLLFLPFLIIDLVVASVHSAFNQDRQQMTDRLLRAIENPNVDILGHPTGRKLLQREPYAFDVDALVNRSVHALKPPSGEQRDAFGEWVRRRPSAPLLALLRRRLRRFDHDRLAPGLLQVLADHARHGIRARTDDDADRLGRKRLCAGACQPAQQERDQRNCSKGHDAPGYIDVAGIVT